MKLFNDNLVLKIMGFLNILFLILLQFLLIYILIVFLPKINFGENLLGNTEKDFFYNIFKLLGIFIAYYLLIIYYRFFQILLKKLQD
jgi:hypothetical protein